MIEITDINDPRIRHYRTLRYTPAGHIEEKIFVAESETVVKKLLESRIEIVSVFALPKYYEKYGNLIEQRSLSPENLFTAKKKLMDEIVGFKLHAGIMAIGKQPVDVGFDNLDSPIIALNGIINSENVGAITRNCAAFGINSLIYDKETSSPYLRRAVRVSMGGVFSVKLLSTDCLMDALKNLQDRGYDIISAENSDNSISINEYKFPERCCLVLGSENKGIDNTILEISKQIIEVPITNAVDSLNVAATSAIFMNRMVNKT